MKALQPTHPLPMSDEKLIVRRIALSALVLGAVCALGCAWLAGPAAAASALLGTLFGLGNLWALAQLVARLLDPRAPKGTKGPMLVLHVAKTLGFFLLAGFLLSRPWVHTIGFMTGFTAVVVAIAVGGLSTVGDASRE